MLGHKVVVVLVGILLALGVTVAPARPASADAPVGVLFGDGLYRFQWDYGSANYNALGQTFVPATSGPLLAVDLLLARESWTSVDLAVEIHQGDPSGPLLATSDPVPAAALFVADPTWIRFTFPTPAQVTAGVPVAITTHTPYPLPGGVPAGPAWFWSWADGSYPGGAAYGGYYSGPSDMTLDWQGPWWDGSDLTFRAWVNTAPLDPAGDLVIQTGGARPPEVGGFSVLVTNPPFGGWAEYFDGAAGWSWSGSRVVAGDVDTDGDVDLVIPHQQSGGGLLLWVVRQTGGYEFAAPVVAQDLRTGGWSFTASRQLLADVDYDGSADLVTLHAQAGQPGLLVWVHRATGTGGFAAPQVWQSLRDGGWSYAASRQVAADVTGDGRADLISIHAQAGNPGLLVWVHRALPGGGFATPQVWADLRTGGWSYTQSRQLAADVTGDGLADLISLHAQTGLQGLLVWVHRALPGGGFAPPQVWQDLRGGGWSYTASRQVGYDLMGDGTADLISMHRDASTGGFRLWVHESTGTTLTAPWVWDDQSAARGFYDQSRLTAGLRYW